LIGVVEFIKPSIIADGVMTVGQLLAYHNEHKKFDTITPVKNDAWFVDAIHHQGLTVHSIPEKGRVILLSEHSERPNGGYFIDITDTIPEENKQIIEHAARTTELDVIGFDIISMDLRLPHSTEPFVFIEGNSLPFIELHMEVYEGTPRDTPAAVWGLWTKK
jgi:cyanophycin synthetase